METAVTPDIPRMEPWSWRNRVTPPSDSDESPRPVTPSCSMILTPPSSGNTVKKPPNFTTETPKKVRESADALTLPRQLKYQCGLAEKKTPILLAMPSILEEGEAPDSRKRSLPMSSHFSPKKKLCCKIGTPLELSRALCVHQKDNSPIKVDLGPTTGQYFPLVLKPPPRRLNAPCPDHEFKLRDIVSELGDANMGLIVKQIFSYLSPADLVNASVVSTRWTSLVHEFSILRNHTDYLELIRVNKENICKTPVDEHISSGVVKSLNETTPLKNWIIINRNPSPKRKVPQLDLSPRSKRFSCYLREGKMLEKGESFAKCVKCCGPAKVSSRGSDATCRVCRHSFCVLCRCSPHPGRTCSFSIPSSPSPPKKRQVIGSKASKKALRRLL